MVDAEKEHNTQAIARTAKLAMYGFGNPRRTVAYQMLVESETPIPTGQIMARVREVLAPTTVAQTTMSQDLDKLIRSELVERVHYGLYSASVFGREFYPLGLKLISNLEALVNRGNSQRSEAVTETGTVLEVIDDERLIEAIRQLSTPKGLINVISTASRRLEELLYPQPTDHSK